MAPSILFGYNVVGQLGDGTTTIRNTPTQILTSGVSQIAASYYHSLILKSGKIAGDYGEKDKSLQFHRKAIEYAPWEHHSRKFECYYLLTHKKQFPEALEAINQTLEVHPGCLVAHQNKIAISINEFKDHSMARNAYQVMKKAAPFHPFTMLESQKISFINP